MKDLFFLIVALLLPVTLCAQVDFNEYKTISSSGSLPDDFSDETYQKVRQEMEQRRDGMTQTQQKEFLESTHYAIDELLHSGFVVFGDKISTYVSEIADKLLEDDQATRASLRFYTLKTNAVNAFSTDQGIIFVTTGLMSQVSNEAQLAFILAHEICHFREKHVLESFAWKNEQNRNHDWVSKMSVYSRDLEFEADRLAVDLYHKAGYSQEALKSTFDVLKYSYLPFDEVKVPKTYFRSSKIYVPDSHFPSKPYEISAEEDQDDSESSHPNIMRRRAAVDSALAIYDNWKDADFLLKGTRFYQTRNIARFESARAATIESDYGDALYIIFLLERDFPTSIYLQRLKAKAWLGLYQFEKKHQTSSTINKISEYEGSSVTFHYLIRKLNEKSMAPMALRQVYDIRQLHSGDDEIEAIFARLINELAWNRKFDPKKFSELTFEAAALEHMEFELSNDSLDTSVIEDTLGSKYDRIKTNSKTDNAAHFDTTKFYLYSISDILNQPEFSVPFAAEKEKFIANEEREKKFAQLPRSERKKIIKKEQFSELHIGATDLICVEPKVYSYTKHGVDHVKSEKLERRFSDALDDASKAADLTLYPIDSRSIQLNGAQGFNERSTLISLLYQIGNDADIECFPVDYQELMIISENYGSANVMFSMAEHYYHPNIKWGAMAVLVLIPPLLVVAASTLIPAAIIQGNKTAISMLVLDVKTGSILAGSTYDFNEPIRKLHLGAHVYDILVKLKTPQ